jgi:hypothetical protein
METVEIVEVLKSAKNLNAALKNLMKREGDNNPDVVAFAKDMRARISGAKWNGIEDFIQRSMERNRQGYFLGLARYAFADVIDPLVEEIIEQFADDFNATYERSEEGVTVVSPDRFREIVSQVSSMADNALKQADIPVNAYSRATMFATVFESDVLEEVQKTL